MPTDFNKVIGFAFSVIIDFREHYRRRLLGVQCEYIFESKECDWPVKKTNVACIPCVESDHLLLGYYFFSSTEVDEFWKYNCIPKAFKFYLGELKNMSYELVYDQVKKCGIHLLYVSYRKRKIEYEVSTIRKEEELHHRRSKYSE